MKFIMRLILCFAFAFGITYWAVNNPKSASSAVDGVISAYEVCADFAKEHFLDKDELKEKSKGE